MSTVLLSPQRRAAIRTAAPRPSLSPNTILTVSLAGLMTAGLFLPVGGANISTDRAVGLALLPLLPYRLLANQGSRQTRLLVWLWFTWCVELFVAAVLSGDLAAHIQPLLMALLPVGYLSALTAGKIDGERANRVARAFLWLLATSGVILLAVEFAGGFGFLLSLDFVDSDGRVRFTTLEPNIFASTLVFLMLCVLPRSRWSVSTVMLYGMALVSLVGAGSRAPLAALVGCLVIYAVLRAVQRGRAVTTTVLWSVWLGGFALLAGLFLLPGVQAIFSTTLSHGETLSVRTRIGSMALTRFQTSPIFGRGPGDFGFSGQEGVSLLRSIGATDVHNLWIPTMPVAILHDSGVVGSLLYLAFLFFSIRRAYKLIEAGSIDHVGYLPAFLSLVVASLTTTVHLNAIFGIAAGLLAAAPARIQRFHSGRREAISGTWRNA